MTPGPPTTAGEPPPRWLGPACLTLGATAALPLFLARFLPFSDWPEQLAAGSALLHWGDPAFRVGEHCTLRVLTDQYLPFHGLVALLTWPVGSVDVAGRLVLLGAFLLLPFAPRRLLRGLGGDERLALLGCMPLWSRPLAFGFAPFVVAIPLFFLALAVLLAREPAPGGRRELALAALAALFYPPGDARDLPT